MENPHSTDHLAVAVTHAVTDVMVRRRAGSVAQESARETVAGMIVDVARRAAHQAVEDRGRTQIVADGTAIADQVEIVTGDRHRIAPNAARRKRVI